MIETGGLSQEQAYENFRRMVEQNRAEILQNIEFSKLYGSGATGSVYGIKGFPDLVVKLWSRIPRDFRPEHPEGAYDDRIISQEKFADIVEHTKAFSTQRGSAGIAPVMEPVDLEQIEAVRNRNIPTLNLAGAGKGLEMAIVYEVMEKSPGLNLKEAMEGLLNQGLTNEATTLFKNFARDLQKMYKSTGLSFWDVKGENVLSALQSTDFPTQGDSREMEAFRQKLNAILIDSGAYVGERQAELVTEPMVMKEQLARRIANPAITSAIALLDEFDSKSMKKLLPGLEQLEQGRQPTKPIHPEELLVPKSSYLRLYHGESSRELPRREGVPGLEWAASGGLLGHGYYTSPSFRMARGYAEPIQGTRKNLGKLQTFFDTFYKAESFGVSINKQLDSFSEVLNTFPDLPSFKDLLRKADSSGHLTALSLLDFFKQFESLADAKSYFTESPVGKILNTPELKKIPQFKEASAVRPQLPNLYHGGQIVSSKAKKLSVFTSKRRLF
jgi:hypothetical protein